MPGTEWPHPRVFKQGASEAVVAAADPWHAGASRAAQASGASQHDIRAAQPDAEAIPPRTGRTARRAWTPRTRVAANRAKVRRMADDLSMA